MVSHPLRVVVEGPTSIGVEFTATLTPAVAGTVASPSNITIRCGVIAAPEVRVDLPQRDGVRPRLQVTGQRSCVVVTVGQGGRGQRHRPRGREERPDEQSSIS